MTPETKKPSEVDSLAADTSKGFDDSDKLPARLERYSTAKRRSLENLCELENTFPENVDQGVVIEKASKRLRTCGSFLEFRNYYTIGKVRLSYANFCCQPLLCPLCAIRKASKALSSYLDRYHVIKAENPSYRLSMVTMTVKNGDCLEERQLHLQKSMQRVFKHRRKALNEGKSKTEWRKVHGYVGTYEVTKRDKGWHPHAHVMVLHTSNFDYKALKEEWKSITGDSHVLNVTAAMHPEEPERDFVEVFKYQVKFSDLTPEENIKAWFVLRRKRLLFCGGAFRGVVVPEKMEDDQIDNLPYVELFYRFIRGNYTLKSAVTYNNEKLGKDSLDGSERSGSEPVERATN